MSRPDLILRAVCAEDLSAFKALFDRVVGGLSLYPQDARDGEIARASVQALGERLLKFPSALWVAQVHANLVGFVVLDFLESDACVEWIGVDTPFRGKGVGFLLLSHVIAICKNMGLNSVYSGTLPHNHSSIHLFLKAGFVSQGVVSKLNYDLDFMVWKRLL